MSRLLTTPVENVEWSRYLREVSEKEKYNSAMIVKLSTELELAEQQKDADVITTYLSSLLLLLSLSRWFVRGRINCTQTIQLHGTPS